MRNYEPMIDDLRKQRDLLGELIKKLDQRHKLNEIDFHLYDMLTKQVEKRLRTIRRNVSGEASRSGRFKYAD